MNLLFCTAKVPVRLSSANRVVSQIVLFRILVNRTLSRETYCGVHANAGFEVRVASTKSYTSQLLTLIMFALMMCEDHKSKQRRTREIIDGLIKLSGMPLFAKLHVRYFILHIIGLYS